MFPVLKLSLDDGKLRNHPLLRGDAPDIKSSAAREISAKMRESQKREGLRFSLATLLPVSDGEPQELLDGRLQSQSSKCALLLVDKGTDLHETPLRLYLTF